MTQTRAARINRSVSSITLCMVAVLLCAHPPSVAIGPRAPARSALWGCAARRRRAVRSLQDLTPDAANANRGTARGRAALQRSLREFGAGRAILVDREGRVVAGNKTFQEAATLGMPVRVVATTGGELVVVQRTDLALDTPKGRQLALADNRVAELDLDWDPDILKQLVADGIALDDLWTAAELDALLGEGVHTGLTEVDVAVSPPATTLQRGALFALGRHRLLCGDATDGTDVARLLDGAVPRMMTTDPPYGVSYAPGWRHAHAPTQRTAVGAVLNDDRVDWRVAYEHFPGDVVYLWHAGVHAAAVAVSLQDAGFDIRAQIVWAKQHFAMSRGDYHWQHEPCWYAVRRGARSHWRGDRTQSTLWSVPNLNPMGGHRGGEDAVTGHGTQKPVRLFERPILNHCDPDEAVFDPFVGSGTTIIAAEKTGRRCFAMELAPPYVQATIDRWQAYTGQRAVRLDGSTKGRGRR
jgi:DNA modification methylase